MRNVQQTKHVEAPVVASDKWCGRLCLGMLFSCYFYKVKCSVDKTKKSKSFGAVGHIHAVRVHAG